MPHTKQGDFWSRFILTYILTSLLDLILSSYIFRSASFNSKTIKFQYHIPDLLDQFLSFFSAGDIFRDHDKFISAESFHKIIQWHNFSQQLGEADGYLIACIGNVQMGQWLEFIPVCVIGIRAYERTGCITRRNGIQTILNAVTKYKLWIREITGGDAKIRIAMISKINIFVSIVKDVIVLLYTGKKIWQL